MSPDVQVRVISDRPLSFLIGFGLEFFLVDYEAFVGALAYHSPFVIGRHLEDQSAAVHVDKFAFTPDLHADGSRSAVGYVHKRAYRTVAFCKEGFYSSRAGLFHERYHHRGRIDFDQSAAYSGSCEFVGHHFFVASLYSFLQHIINQRVDT